MEARDATYSAEVDGLLRSRRTVRAFEVEEVPIETAS